MSSTIYTCPRCGIARQARRPNLCIDCRTVEATTTPPAIMRGPTAARLNELLAMRTRIDTEIAALQRAAEHRNGLRRSAICGTESGYSKHRREGEQTCEACKKARAAGEQRRAARRMMRRSPQEVVDEVGAVVGQSRDHEISAQRKAS